MRIIVSSTGVMCHMAPADDNIISLSGSQLYVGELLSSPALELLSEILRVEHSYNRLLLISFKHV